MNNRRNETMKEVHAHIKENSVSIGISIISVNTIKPLWELNIADSLSKQWIHHETHRLPKSLTVIDVVITIQVQQIRCICEHSRNSDLFDGQANQDKGLQYKIFVDCIRTYGIQLSLS